MFIIINYLTVPDEDDLKINPETVQVKKRLNSVLRHVEAVVIQKGEPTEMVETLRRFRNDLETVSTMNGVELLYKAINEKIRRYYVLQGYMNQSKANKIKSTWEIIRANVETHFNFEALKQAS